MDNTNQDGLIEDRNQMHGMQKSDFTDIKLDKQRELNTGMSVQNHDQNAYQRKIQSIAGSED